MNQKNRRKYLTRNGFEPDFDVLTSYDFYVVIPVRRERELLPETLNSLIDAAAELSDRKVAYVIVINSSSDDGDRICEENHFVETFCDAIPDVFVIDRFRKKRLIDGVGEARRIGMDHVVSWCEHNPWIVSLDADTNVESNFFSALEDMSENVVLAPFKHRDRSPALEEYEAWLHYFRDGLAYANSPYAYVPLGCRFSLRLETYIESGGMVKRTAGEDFHFLQKLTKLMMPDRFGIADTCVYPSGRVSDRVPWGTGPAVGGINNEGKRFNKVEPSAAFHEVKILFKSVEELFDTDVGFSNDMMAFLVAERFIDVLAKLRANSKTKYQFSKLFHQWFDGLRTIRFVNNYTRRYGKEPIEIARSRF